MVGDVKQSIYRFRLADPSIFLSKYDAYPPLGEQDPGEPRKLLLSQNFRSRPEILEAANDVFSLVMKKKRPVNWTTRRQKRLFPAHSSRNRPAQRSNCTA